MASRECDMYSLCVKNIDPCKSFTVLALTYKGAETVRVGSILALRLSGENLQPPLVCLLIILSGDASPSHSHGGVVNESLGASSLPL